MAKDISVRLRANTDQYNRALRQAADETRKFGGQVTNAAARPNATDAAGPGRWIGAMTRATGGVAASRFAGVRKTTTATEAEFQALSQGIRDMAKQMPASAVEIAGVAEAAGQLGIKKDAILGFSETMVQLGETTNLTATDAATELARLSNIMGTSSADVGRMGSTIVELGNNSATTEAEIVTLATRLAAAGSIAGLTEADVLAFASTLTSVGVEAEAGGTALSKVFTSIRDAVIDGSSNLEVFAETAGVSVDEFKTAFERDAAGAISMFISGLGELSDSGQSTTAVFEELSLTDQRLMRALLSTAGAGELLNEQLAMGSDAWAENTALAAEAEQRYQTTAAQLEVMKNNVVDLAIGLGDAMLPAVRAVAGATGDLASGFASMPSELQGVAAATVGVTGALAGAAGGFVLLAPRLVEVAALWKQLNAAHPGLAGGIAKIGFAGAGATVGLALLAQALGNASAQADKLVASITTDIDMNSLGSMSGGLEDIKTQLKELDEEWAEMGDGAALGNLGRGFRSLIEIATPLENKVFDNVEATKALREAQKDLVTQQSWVYSNSLQLADALGISQEAVVELVDKTGTDLSGSYEDVEGAIRGAREEMTASLTPMDKVTISAEDQEEAAKELARTNKKLGESYGSFTDPMLAYREVLAENQEAVRESAQAEADAHNKKVDAEIRALSAKKGNHAEERALLKDSKKSWEDFAGGVGASLDEVTDRLEKQLVDQEKWRSNLVDIASRGREDLAMVLADMGPEAAGLVAQFGDLTEKEFQDAANTWVLAHRDGGEGSGQVLRQELQNVAAIAADGGKSTVDELAAKLEVAPAVVKYIATSMGIELKTGTTNMETVGRDGAAATAAAITTAMSLGVPGFAAILGTYGATVAYTMNPIITSSGGRPINTNRAATAPGVQMANGGFAEDHTAQIAPAGAWRVWAEPETGGEAYIPLSPAKRARSLGIWAETGRRLGVDHTDTHFAAGGISYFADGGIPRPPGMAPYGGSIAAAGAAGMNRAYEAAVAFMEANSLGSGPGGSVTGGDLVAIGKALQAQGFRVSRHPAFGGLPRSGHSPNSLHYKGRAIDVNYGPGGQSAEEMRAIDALMPKLAGIPFREKLWRTKGHYDHLHLAMQEGGILNPHVRDSGGPLKPGFTFNGTGGNEMVIPMANGGIIGGTYEQRVEANNNRFAQGVLSVADHLENLQRRFIHAANTTGRFSDETTRARQALVDFQQSDYQRRVDENNNRFAQGALSAADHLANLERRFAHAAATTGRFSDETTRARQTLLDFQDSDYQRRVEENNRKFEAGLISNADQLRNLERRLQRAVQVSGEWSDAADTARRNLKQFQDEDYQRRVNENSNRFELGLISNADQLYNLTARLKRAVKETGEFSDETMSARKNLSEFTGQFSDPISSLGNIVDRMSGHELGSDPMQGGRLVSSSEELRNMLDHQVETARLWDAQLRLLAGQGHSKGLLEDLARKGPDALGLAKALEGIDPAHLARTNDELLKYGRDVAGMFTGQSFTFGAGSVVVNVGAGADKAAVRDGVTEAMSLLRSSTMRGRTG